MDLMASRKAGMTVSMSIFGLVPDPGAARPGEYRSMTRVAVASFFSGVRSPTRSVDRTMTDTKIMRDIQSFPGLPVVAVDLDNANTMRMCKPLAIDRSQRPLDQIDRNFRQKPGPIRAVTIMGRILRLLLTQKRRGLLERVGAIFAMFIQGNSPCAFC